MQPVHSKDEFLKEIADDTPVIAVFKADWCKDCKFIEPFMPDVEARYADRFRFLAVDRDELPDLCAEYDVLGIPSFIAFRRGRELVRFVSKLRKTREEIEQFLDRAHAVAQAVGTG
jgi:thioredoxin-like negative regulator of GroEL